MKQDYKALFQLAKEKGYKPFWFDNPLYQEDMPEYYWISERALLEKWLRDKHRIFVLLDFGVKDSYCFRIMKYTYLYANLYLANTYEESMLLAISEALTLIPIITLSEQTTK